MEGFLKFIAYIIIFFFVWNFLKKIFFKKLYQKFPFPNQQEQKTKQTTKNPATKVKWDAETVEYEEIKENDKEEK